MLEVPCVRYTLTCVVVHPSHCRPGDDVVLEEVREFQATVLVATLTGFLLGGLVGARYAGDKFVKISHSAKFSSTMQAQVRMKARRLVHKYIVPTVDSYFVIVSECFLQVVLWARM